MNQALIDYFRCPEEFAEFVLAGTLSEASGYFRFGHNAICYGQCSAGFLAPRPIDGLYDALDDVTSNGSATRLPFDPTQIVENFRRERYFSNPSRGQPKRALESIVRDAYYLVRPLLPVSIRRHAQRIHLRGWHRIPFPHWPVDRTVDHIMENLLRLSLKSGRAERIPFIWFWPEGVPSCAIVTHDVEAAAGRDSSSTLMDIDDAYGIKTSFQVVPEKRYKVTSSYLESIRSRGFEINVQDLNHDGHLFRDHKEFLRRAEKINRYVNEYGAQGFRAAVLYRNAEWFDALDIAYDMSIPSVAHLEPQRGGCCTVMPYFIGKALELPLTTTQDYALFQILGDYSIELWKQQMALIMEKHGLVSFIVHPDYIISEKARDTYRALLSYLVQLRSQKKIWITLPGEVNRWWRKRHQMKLVRQGSSWRIEGPGCARARVAYARLAGDRVVYHVEPRSCETATP
jgi:hypothetical protein